MIQQSTEAIAIISPIGKPFYVAPSIVNVLGYTEEEMLLKDIFSLVHPDDKNEMQNVLTLVLANKGKYSGNPSY